MRRGDIILCALQGDYGKPRPAVVVQTDIVNETHESITLCPLTTHLIDASLFRISILPGKQSGLKQTSQVMVDKITSQKRVKLREKIGELTIDQLKKINAALRFWQDLN
ncbi:MAG: hypothetical protein A3E82_03560 [Gammaproteobacteria bacterium RIFCSPHIGHO2_12_FULL_38_11]|nr:MAG: hypothetical protein A3E82_03560 [Gammaproteobacteria bacterium RIFCSPHIGHO2_12_FULL_38_11]